MVATASMFKAFEAHLDQDLPDITVQVKEYRWAVHSRVLSQESPVFEMMCNGKFREAQEKIIELKDDNPGIVARMIIWIYGIDARTPYPFCKAQMELVNKMIRQGCSPSDFATRQKQYSGTECEHHARLYRIADKYNIAGLMDATKKALIGNMISTPSLSTTIGSILGGVVLAKDEKLCSSAMHAHLTDVRDAVKAYNTWCTIFKEDQDIQKRMREFIWKSVDKVLVSRKNMFESMNKAIKCCEEAEARMTYHPNNNPAKEKLREAVKVLSEIPDKPKAL